MVISHQLSRRSVISTSVPSCSTKRSVADLSGELFTAVESDITTASGLRVTKTPGDVAVVDTVGAGDSFMGGMIDAMWGMGLRGADAREALRSLPEEQVRAIIDRASAVSDVTVSRKGANPPWAHELP